MALPVSFHAEVVGADPLSVQPLRLSGAGHGWLPGSFHRQRLERMTTLPKPEKCPEADSERGTVAASLPNHHHAIGVRIGQVDSGLERENELVWL